LQMLSDTRYLPLRGNLGVDMQTLIHIGTLIAEYLADHWACTCTLEHIEQIPGGASRETYLVQLKRQGQPLGVVVRRDPPSSLIDTERAHEYNTYAAIYRDGVVPVPEPIVLEESPQALEGKLERPFSVMTLISEGQASPAGLDDEAMQPVLTTLGQNKWSLLGKLAAKTPQALGVDQFMDIPEHPAARELAYWRTVINTDALHPQPIAQAALRWLDRNLPPPSNHLTLVHGDYRTGNYLYTPQGAITAVLDWEMAHIGDPLEDLAWSFDPLWSNDMHKAGRLLPREKALQIWQEASGLSVDREVFKWWQVFASIKAIAIWISSAEDYVNGTTKEPILAMAGWPMIDRQNRILLDRIAPESKFDYAEALI
jgi:aminoglycoside phosphotransferase (APT) family kinase protein